MRNEKIFFSAEQAMSASQRYFTASLALFFRYLSVTLLISQASFINRYT